MTKQEKLKLKANKHISEAEEILKKLAATEDVEEDDEKYTLEEAKEILEAEEKTKEKKLTLEEAKQILEAEKRKSNLAINVDEKKLNNVKELAKKLGGF